jgi:hypothetical protein
LTTNELDGRRGCCISMNWRPLPLIRRFANDTATVSRYHSFSRFATKATVRGLRRTRLRAPCGAAANTVPGLEMLGHRGGPTGVRSHRFRMIDLKRTGHALVFCAPNGSIWQTPSADIAFRQNTSIVLSASAQCGRHVTKRQKPKGIGRR